MKKETLLEYTERAIEATDLGKLIPPIVYLPSRLRLQGKRLTIDNVRVTVTPPTIAENHIRIAEADPLGFLIAIMNGQPIPSFEITNDGAIVVKYHIPEMKTRERIGQWLANKVTIRTNEVNPGTGNLPKPSEEWEALVEAREQGKRVSPIEPASE